MTKTDTDNRGGRMRIARSRGAASGILLMLLGVWGALIAFIGPQLDFAYTPDQAWTWTAARGWLEVLPGAATIAGGLLLLASRNRATAMLGSWLTVLAGAWFVVGRAFAGPLNLGDPGAPVASTETKRVWLELAYFSGLGAVIVFLGALALGRLSVRTLRDVEYAQRPVPATEPTPAPASEATAAKSESEPEPAGREERVAEAETAEQGERVVEPETARETEAETEGEQHRHRFGGLFRRHHETTTTR